MPKSYKSDISAAIHETIEGLHKAGLVDKQTMRRFDERCLTIIEKLTGPEIAALRDREGVSQTVFARYLNVPMSLVSQWERDERRPSGAALKLLALVREKGLSAIT